MTREDLQELFQKMAVSCAKNNIIYLADYIEFRKNISQPAEDKIIWEPVDFALPGKTANCF